MGKKKKNNNSFIIKIAICSAVFIIGLIVSIVGIIKYTGVELKYDEAIIKCDDKDYSSYTKREVTTTPGNENINNQIESVERAMQRAKEANDYSAWGQLWEKYNELLALQSQTSTESITYDDSEAVKAKKKCYNLAYKQKESDKQTGLVLIIVGAVVSVISIGVGLFVLFRNNKK